MTTLFYLLGVLPFIWELTCVVNPKKNHSFVRLLDNKMNEQNLSISQLTETEKNFTILNFGYFLWTIIGLFTSNWIIFLAIILLSLLLSSFKKYVLVFWVDSLITLTLITLAILNYHHFQIDIFEYLKSLF
jgi:hypothetical protein